MDRDLALARTVEACLKPAQLLVEEYSEVKADVDHAYIGITTEVGELGSILKKFTKYSHELDREHVKEELGDIEFYLEALRQTLCISRDEVVDLVVDKLNRRYPDGYSDQSAKDRLDKICYTLYVSYFGGEPEALPFTNLNEAVNHALHGVIHANGIPLKIVHNDQILWQRNTSLTGEQNDLELENLLT